MSSSRRRFGLILVIAIVELVLACALGYLLAALDNSLANNGRWIASKAELDKRVIGARAFFTSRRTLSGEHLDLGRWFGFQEIVLAEPLELEELAFSFRPRKDGYLCVLFEVGEERMRGVRFGGFEDNPSLAFTSDAKGHFVARDELARVPISRNVWNRARLLFGREAITVTVGEAVVAELPPVAERTQRIGFRSGRSSVLLDDVLLRTSGGLLLHEGFFDRTRLVRYSMFSAVGLWSLTAVALRLLRPRRRRLDQRVLVALGACAVLVASLALVAYRALLSGQYGRRDPAAARLWVDDEARRVRGELARRELTPASRALEVLIVGTSQTWGAGASRPGEGFVEVLAAHWGAAHAECKLRCTPVAVQGAKSPLLVDIVSEILTDVDPALVVVNLSNNDDDPQVFHDALLRLVTVCRASAPAAHILFVLEANSPEKHAAALPMHAVMRETAEATDVAVFDMHTALRAHQDSGFLWWDFVHPTSWGHALIARELAGAIEENFPNLCESRR